MVLETLAIMLFWVIAGYALAMRTIRSTEGGHRIDDFFRSAAIFGGTIFISSLGSIATICLFKLF